MSNLRDIGTFEMVKTIRSEKAKQGRWGIPVLMILVIGVILALLVWIGVGIYGAAIDKPQPGKTIEQNVPAGKTGQGGG